jgi:hypothetical protein
VPLGVFVWVTATILGPSFVVVVLTKPLPVRLVLVFLVTIFSHLSGFEWDFRESERRLAPRTRTPYAERDPARNQNHADNWRHPLTVGGLNAQVCTPDLNAFRLSVGDRDDQRGDAKHNQKDPGKQQNLHSKPLFLDAKKNAAKD